MKPHSVATHEAKDEGATRSSRIHRQKERTKNKKTKTKHNKTNEATGTTPMNLDSKKTQDATKSSFACQPRHRWKQGEQRNQASDRVNNKVRKLD